MSAVSIVDPAQMLNVAGENPELAVVAQEAAVRLRRVVDALAAAGARATFARPVAWLRMEPPGELGKPAEVRLTTWFGGEPEEQLLAYSGYHGRPVRRA